MPEYISKNYYATEFGFHFFREAFNESTQKTGFRVNVMSIRGKNCGTLGKTLCEFFFKQRRWCP